MFSLMIDVIVRWSSLLKVKRRIAEIGDPVSYRWAAQLL